MLYKPDFEAACEHMQAFWAGEPIGRPLLRVVCKSDSYRPLDESGVDLLTRKTDIDYILARFDRELENTRYLAEAVPVYVPGLVCSDMAAFFVEDLDIRGDTVWYPEMIGDWAAHPLQFDPRNRWWQLVRWQTLAAVERCRDRYLIGVPDFQPGMDTISLLRSPARVCLDLVDNPAPVKRAVDYIIDTVYRYCYNEFRSLVACTADLVSDWMGLFSSGNHDIIQCDFIALVGAQHFEEFCLPGIERQCRMLDTSVFHLDGPDAVRHLDRLLEVRDLGAIQWVPGAGKPPAVGWLPVLKRVQQAGKGLYISSPPEDVPEILEHLSSRGLMIAVERLFESVAEGEAFMREVERTCRPHRQVLGS